MYGVSFFGSRCIFIITVNCVSMTNETAMFNDVCRHAQEWGIVLLKPVKISTLAVPFISRTNAVHCPFRRTENV